MAPQSAENAPKIELPLRRESKISTVSNPSVGKVSFVDARPEIEKLYYPGQEDPHHWRDAMTVLPMESFQPDLNHLLTECLTSNIIVSDKSTAIVCEVTSFQVALDERERGEEDLLYEYKLWDDDRIEREEKKREQERQEEELRRQRVRSGQEDEKKSMADVVAGFIFKAAVVAPIKSKLTHDAKKAQLVAHPQTLPTTLTDGKQSGWNCQIAVQIKTKSSSSPPADTRVQVNVHRRKDDSQSVKSQLQQLIAEAVAELGKKIAVANP